MHFKGQDTYDPRVKWSYPYIANTPVAPPVTFALRCNFSYVIYLFITE